MARDRAAEHAMRYDAVLVGAGAGSMLAALLLKQSGLRPVIVEKTSLVGGATAYSGGIVWAPCNHRMKQKGVPDSPEDALAYLADVSGGRGDPAIQQAYVEAIPRVVEQVEALTGLRWVTYPGLPDYYAERVGGTPGGRYLLPHGEQVREILTAAAARSPAMSIVRPAVHLGDRRQEWRWGRALVGCLWARIIDEGIPVLLGHRAMSLVQDGGRVAGILAQGPDGSVSIHGDRGVLLDTGGFEWDAELSRRHVPGPFLNPQTPPANEGDGHRMAAEAGAAFALMDQTIGMPAIRVAGEDNDGRQLYRILFQELALPHAIVVNERGRRFANETFFVDVANAWAATDAAGLPANLPCFLVFDDEYVRRYGMPSGSNVGLELVSASSIAGLAGQAGIDAGGLEREVASYNQAMATGVQDPFGRGSSAYQRAFGDHTVSGNPTTGPVERPPFHALRLHPATSGHRGGMVIGQSGQVLAESGDTIAGLFACGTCAAGTLTGATYFTGTAVGHSLVFAAAAASAMARPA